MPVTARLVLLGTAFVWLAFEARQSSNHRPDADTADRGGPLLLVGVGVAGFVVATVVGNLNEGEA